MRSSTCRNGGWGMPAQKCDSVLGYWWFGFGFGCRLRTLTALGTTGAVELPPGHSCSSLGFCDPLGWLSNLISKRHFWTTEFLARFAALSLCTGLTVPSSVRYQ